jgi:hypothetical protein
MEPAPLGSSIRLVAVGIYPLEQWAGQLYR